MTNDFAGITTRKGVKANHSQFRLVNITDGNTIRRIRWNEAEKLVNPINPTWENPAGVWHFCPKKFKLEV